jgi:hypothetical protein
VFDKAFGSFVASSPKNRIVEVAQNVDIPSFYRGKLAMPSTVPSLKREKNDDLPSSLTPQVPKTWDSLSRNMLLICLKPRSASA